MADTMLSQTQISTYFRSMAMLLRAGETAGQACDEARKFYEENEHGALARVAGAMAEAIEGGSLSFAEAAEKTGVFPVYALGMLRVKNDTGRLEAALDGLADYYERQEALNQRLRSNLTYPVVLLLLMCAVLSVLVFSVLPMFEKVYNSLTGSLAASSYAYVSAAGTIGRVSLTAAAAVSLVLLVLTLYLRRASGWEKLQGPMETFPLTRKASRLLAVSRLLDTLSTLLSSGASQEAAMETAVALIDHRLLRQVMEENRSGSITENLLDAGVLPSLYSRVLLFAARKTGSLSISLMDISTRLEQEAEAEMAAIIDSTEPVLIGFLTVAVGLTLVSVMLPLLGILGAV